MKELSQQEWKEQYENDENAFLLDVRTDEEYEEKHIPNSTQLDIFQAQKQIISTSYNKTTPKVKPYRAEFLSDFWASRRSEELALSGRTLRGSLGLEIQVIQDTPAFGWSGELRDQ